MLGAGLIQTSPTSMIQAIRGLRPLCIAVSFLIALFSLFQFTIHSLSPQFCELPLLTFFIAIFNTHLGRSFF